MPQKAPRPPGSLSSRRATGLKEFLQSASVPTSKATRQTKQADHEARHGQKRQAVIVPCSARLIIGRLRILLLAEGLPDRDWWVLDYFPLTSIADHDLLMVVHEMRQTGYGGIKSDLSPGVFSPGGAQDPVSRAAMQRLRGSGLPATNEIMANLDPKLICWADGDPRPRRSRK
jgi:hypothetical protein